MTKPEYRSCSYSRKRNVNITTIINELSFEYSNNPTEMLPYHPNSRVIFIKFVNSPGNELHFYRVFRKSEIMLRRRPTKDGQDTCYAKY